MTQNGPLSNKSESESESEDEYKVEEESPCGRWHKRKEQVSHSVVPGTDAAYLAMDIEDGVEVIWNEVTFAEKKDFISKEKQMMENLNSLISIAHPNIVKFHNYWIDRNRPKIRVVFITEYTGGSGTLKDFLRRTKYIQPAQVKNWTRWCNQILSSLHYMHSLQTPTVHGNLTTDTIFLQHHGLLKIGCFSIDTIRCYAKSETAKNRNMKNHRYFPDELISTAFDIYSFGVIALEMLAPSLMVQFEAQNLSTLDFKVACQSAIRKYLDNPDSDSNKTEFIELCLRENVSDRPDAKALSRHRALFELSPLQILASHKVYEYRTICQKDLDYQLKKVEAESDDTVICFCIKDGARLIYTRRQLPLKPTELDKLILDVQNGLYPVNGMEVSTNGAGGAKAPVEPDEPVPEVDPTTEICHGTEDRRAAHIECIISQDPASPGAFTITIDVDLAGPHKIDDKSSSASRTPECKRRLETKLRYEDTPQGIAQELSRFAFISSEDVNVLTEVIEDQYKLVNPFSSSMSTQTAANQVPITSS